MAPGRQCKFHAPSLPLAIPASNGIRVYTIEGCVCVRACVRVRVCSNCQCTITISKVSSNDHTNFYELSYDIYAEFGYY